MSWFSGTPRTGDWVVLTETVKTSALDHLVGGDSGIKRGTRGVVVGTPAWGAVEVVLDAGLAGLVTARVRPRQLRVVRRRGGVDAFATRTGHRNAVRAGLALALLGPFASFAMAWVLEGGSSGGRVATLIDGSLQGGLDLVAFGVAHPLSAAFYVAVITAAWRFAFGR